jgi:hypothetical protein
MHEQATQTNNGVLINMDMGINSFSDHLALSSFMSIDPLHLKEIKYNCNIHITLVKVLNCNKYVSLVKCIKHQAAIPQLTLRQNITICVMLTFWVICWHHHPMMFQQRRVKPLCSLKHSLVSVYALSCWYSVLSTQPLVNPTATCRLTFGIFWRYWYCHPHKSHVHITVPLILLIF